MRPVRIGVVGVGATGRQYACPPPSSRSTPTCRWRNTSRTTRALFARPPVEEVSVPAEDGGESHFIILENFRDAILAGAPLVAPAEEAIRSLEIGNAMLLSGLLGKTVELPIDADLMERELRRLASR
jgi:hypothetical protein